MTKLAKDVLALSIGALIAPCSFGQAEKIGIFKVAFDEPAQRDQEFAKPIFLKLRDTTHMPDRFHARLFRGSVADLKKRTPDAQGCVHFPTLVFPVTYTGGIQIPTLDNPAWLQPAGDGFRPQEYTIVFESGDEPSIGDIRLHKGELNSYFQYAFSMRLMPPENLKRQVVETVREGEAVLHTSTITYQQASRSVCWGVRAVLSADELPVDPAAIVRVAELLPCGAGAPGMPDSATAVMEAAK